jgi:hypothetical protein
MIQSDFRREKMATYPNDPNLSQFTDFETVIDDDRMNELIDNVNEIGEALADIASNDGQIHMGTDKRLYFKGDTKSIYFNNAGDKFVIDDEVDMTGHILRTGNGFVVGDLDVTGTLTKGGGAFKIDHPVDEKKKLLHGFIEGPEYGLLYRGKMELENGKAIINIDTACGMMSGTFAALAMNPTIYLQNLTGFTAIRPGEIDGAEFEIMAQDPESTDEISWLVCAERKDAFVMESESTDDEGHLILEPVKEAEVSDG